MLVDYVVSKHNLFERFGSSNNDFSRAKDTGCDFFHVACWFEFDFDRRITIRFKGNLKDIGILLEVLRRQHKIDVVVEAEVGVDHHHAKRVGRWYNIFVERLQDVYETRDDILAVEQVFATGNLNTSIGKDLDGFDTVTVVIRQGNLVVECRGFQ